MGRRERRLPKEWLFTTQDCVGRVHPVDGSLLGPKLTCTGGRQGIWGNLIVHCGAGSIPLKREEGKGLSLLSF